MVTDKKTRLIFLAVAAVLLAVAAVLYFTADNSGLKELCGSVNAFGYDFVPDDWYAAGGEADSTILSLADGEDLSEVAAASLSAGFPSDVEKRGEVVLLLARTENDDVVTAYVVNGEIELCFVQTLDGAIKALGE
ncbi:MAG: hypothetical protein ABFC62_12120 [Clostridiaceae bacterium]